jgi:hypothetical protein
MTLNDIISTSLVMLERGTDAHTIDHYRAQFTKYANDAVEEIIQRVKQERKETLSKWKNEEEPDTRKSGVLNDDNTFHVNTLERSCLRVTAVFADGKPVFYKQNPAGSGNFVVHSDADEIEVYYRYFPKPMSSSTDQPELPEHMHSVIPYYVVACTRCGGDPYMQGASSAHFSIFNEKVYNLERMHRGEPSSFKLLFY